ncbi:hypothetical protein SEA_CHARM_72 [Mycobacterium phage Charm]|nr:hypothetical protein SEA_CHARM_72 [Mycobacterium phage Charm]QGJ88349.1 hypothetical protein SEA_DREAMTEAM1_72 [Mycobacterium phage DreamTeam1]
MYVEDVHDLNELRVLHREAVSFLGKNPNSEQAQWDVEDIEERIGHLSNA